MGIIGLVTGKRAEHRELSNGATLWKFNLAVQKYTWTRCYVILKPGSALKVILLEINTADSELI